MIRLDTATGRITCPIGDTGLFTINLTDASGGALEDNLTGVGIFAVADKRLMNTYIAKAVPIVDNSITVHLTNADTRSLTAGTHCWDVRIVTDPEYDNDGNVVCEDDTDEVHSLYSAIGLPEFIATGVAVHV